MEEDDEHVGALAASPDADAAGAPDPPAERRRRQLNKGKLLLPVMIATSVACILVLNLRTELEEAEARQRPAELELDGAFAGLGDGSGSDPGRQSTEQLADTFRYEVRQRQVPPDQLRGNPFALAGPGQTPSSMDLPQASGGDDESRSAVPEEAMAAVRKLQLQAILLGSAQVTAIISNNLLTEGQKIDGWTVSKIRPKDVVLTWGDHEHVIKLPR